jgi:hypothetical protein
MVDKITHSLLLPSWQDTFWAFQSPKWKLNVFFPLLKSSYHSTNVDFKLKILTINISQRELAIEFALVVASILTWQMYVKFEFDLT